MQNLAINPNLIIDTNTFTFSKTVKVETPNRPEWQLMIDVYYNGQRIAILNGLSAPLQWTAKNGSNIPLEVIEQLEQYVSSLIERTSGLEKLDKNPNVNKNTISYKEVKKVLEGSNKSGVIHPCYPIGSGKWSNTTDQSANVKWLLEELGLEYTEGNDAPRGGQTGKYIKVIL